MRVAIAGRDKNYFSLIAKSVYKQKSLPFNSVCFGENAKDVMRIVQKEKPVLLIWDIEGQEEQALATIRNIKTQTPHIRVVIINSSLDASSVRTALRYDVDDYLIKPLTQKEITDSLLEINFDNIQISNNCSAVDLALKYMQKNCTSPITLDDVADQCFVSPCYLSRLIKDKTGKTFVENLRDMRLTRAEWLLLNTNQKVQSIAKSVGFSNASYFTYVFRKEKGVTPTAFKETRNSIQRLRGSRNTYKENQNTRERRQYLQSLQLRNQFSQDIRGR